MKLADEHIEVLKEARDILFKEKRHFICAAIMDAAACPHESIQKAGREKQVLFKKLVDAVSLAINGHLTLISWVVNQSGVDVDQPLALCMRLAWLDRMIETGEIA